MFMTIRLTGCKYSGCFITARNEVGARLYFHRRLFFCPQWGVRGRGACVTGGMHGREARMAGSGGVCGRGGMCGWRACTVGV